MPIAELAKKEGVPVVDTGFAYPETKLLIDGEWCDGRGWLTIPVTDPATGETIRFEIRTATKSDKAERTPVQKNIAPAVESDRPNLSNNQRARSD